MKARNNLVRLGQVYCSLYKQTLHSLNVEPVGKVGRSCYQKSPDFWLQSFVAINSRLLTCRLVICEKIRWLMWSLNSNSILVSDCKQSDCKPRAAHGGGSRKRKFASSNGSPRITGYGECSRWVPRLGLLRVPGIKIKLPECECQLI